MESERPIDDEAEAWAERERKRREEWLQGPTGEEKAAWARAQRWRGRIGLAESPLPPSKEEVEAWAESERKRRAAWVAGPSEEDKREWARRRAAAGPSPEPISQSGAEDELLEIARRVMRQAEL